MKQMLLVLGALSLTTCAQQSSPPPDAVTGLQGVATEAGSLAGTWGMVVELATILTLPVFGDRNAGSQNLWLVTRSWDASAGVYRDSFVWCDLEVWEVEGNKLTVSPETLHKHPAVHFSSTVDHASGSMKAEHVLDIWGLRNLPDPYNTELPTRHNWEQSPQRDWIYDEDEDGKPATTGHTTGAAAGEVYQVVRGIYTFDATVIGPDRIQGLTTMEKYEQNVIDATNPLAEGESKVRQDPDPRNTWLDMARLREGATCDDAIQARADGRLSATRPF
ncbi:MAG: hypothetical protein AB2A00_24060 [Myxococcota bacterium]